mgnify:CR=1 FL=1
MKLGNIGDWGAGSTPNRSNKSYYENGDVLWVKTGELNDGYIFDSIEKITTKALNECSLRNNNIGDVLIAMYGATIGKLGITAVPLTTNQACCACTPFSFINNEYLFYYLMAIKPLLISKSYGGAQPNISKEKITNCFINFPKIDEQILIVNKIKELFKKIETIGNEYNSIINLISATKRKVLEEIFGENSSYKSYYPITKGILSNFCDKITKGTTPTSYGFKYQSSGIPFVKVENVDNFKINLNTINCYISEETHEFQKRSQLKEDDILFSIAGTIGKLCLVRKENTPANTNQAFAIISGYNKYIAPKYLLYYLEWTKHSNSKVDSHGLGMNNATLTGLKNLEIWFPQEISNQQKIVYEIENILSKLKQIIS